ncbi:FecR family protein [Chitinophaga sp. RAB17]|uniref:FecR family protein n=1 Tax=Chitinophaga sp. RAB17 TaxID=3233049 RepID=UPI003F90D0C2
MKDQVMTEDEFLIKYQRFLDGDCSPEEIAELNAYHDHMQLEDGIWDIDTADQSLIKEEIAVRLAESTRMEPVRLQPVWWNKWRVAAVIAGIGFGFYGVKVYQRVHERKVQQLATAALSHDREEKKIYLTLGNGEKISITDAGKGTVTEASGVAVNKNNNDQLSYQHGGAAAANSATPEVNTLSTPGGMQFSITLADGSKVRLNASSSLRFPAYFTDNKREVYLTGEAFFEVVADPAHPFIVHVNDQAVQALGTSFNIKAYPEEKTAKTTLLTGAVNVKLPTAVKPLRVGEQLHYNVTDQQAWLSEVNVETVTAWKDGLFLFENERIDEIMLEIGRWYNMKVVFSAGNVSRKFSGKIYRNKKIEDVLKILDLTGAMNFRIINNQIMVTIP